MIVHVKPRDPKRVFGHLSHSGKLTKGGKTVPHWPVYIGAEKFTMNGFGVILNLEKPEDKVFYEIITESDQLKGKFSKGKDGKRTQGARFYIEDLEADAKTYLSEREERATVDSFIASLDEKQTLRFGLPLGLKGSYAGVRSSLYKMSETTEGRKKLSAFINNKNRVVIETIYEALKYGDAANKKGLWKDGREMFYFNSDAVGLGIDQAVVFFRNPENVDFYKALKDMLLMARGDKDSDIPAPKKKTAPGKQELTAPGGTLPNIEIPE